LWLTVAIEITKKKLPSSRKDYETWKSIADGLLMAKDKEKEKEKEKDGDKKSNKLQKVIELLGDD
jgi:hypothetical protein